MLAALAGATSRIGLIATAPPPIPSRSTWRGSSPRSTTSAAAGSAGTSSPPGSPRRPATSAARPGEPRRPLRARRGIHARGDGPVGQLGGRRGARRPRQRALCRAPTGIRAVNHAGAHYQVAGPLNMPRCPQGRPVFVQAGSSDTGRRFAARHAEAVFTAQMEKATAQDFYADLKALAAKRGPRARPGADPARPQPGDRLHRGRGAAPGARAERPDRSRGRAASGCPAGSAGTTSRTCRSTSRCRRRTSPIPARSRRRAAGPR